MDSAKFQGSATSTPFAPLKALDQTDAMRQQLNEQVRWMREDQQMVIDDRRQYAAALERRARENQGFREKDLEALAGMSKTLTDTLLKVQKDKNENDQEEGLALARQYGIPLEQAQKFDADEKALIDARDKTNEYANRVAKSGAPPEVIEQIRNLSGWKRYGYMTGLAQEAGLKWGDYLENALATDDKTQVDLGNGRVITPAQAQDKAELAAVTQVLSKQFLREMGLTGANPALLNKYTFPSMRQGEEPVIRSRYRALQAQKTEETLAEQTGILVTGARAGTAGEAFNGFVSSLRAVVDPKTGLLLGPRGAAELAASVLAKEGADGTIPETVVDEIASQFIPGSTTETWGGKFPQLFTGLRDTIRKGREEDLNAQEQAEERWWKDFEKQTIAYAQSVGGLSEEQKNDLIKKYGEAGRSLPDGLAGLVTTDQREEKQIRDDLDAQIAFRGGITREELLSGGYPLSIIRDYMPKAVKFEEDVTKNKAFQAGVKGIELRLLNLTLNATSQGARPHWTLELAKGEAYRLLVTATQKYRLEGNDPETAARLAVDDVNKLINIGQPTSKGPGNGPFAVAVDKVNPTVALPNGGFVNLAGGPRAQAADKGRRFERLRTSVMSNKANSRFLQMPLLQSIYPEDLKRLNEQLRNDPLSGFPESVKWMAREARLSPWDVADYQLEAAGLARLVRPAEVQWESTLDPRWRQLLNFSPSNNRTQRAFTGVPWNINKVPNGYGVHIEKAAKQYGLDPALLAGLLQQENPWWDPRRVSSAGAVGLGQIRADTIGDAGMTSLNDRLDPIKSIYGAARVLSTRIKAFNGDVTMGLRAYNMGLGGARRNPGGYPGDDESINYPTRVLQRASGFGYGYGAGSPFRRQEAMHPSIGGLSPVQTRLANTSSLVQMRGGLCTTAVLETLAANKIPNPKDTGKDGNNNPRGLASQLVNDFGWRPLPGLGRPETINSPYGRFTVNMMTNAEYQQAIQAGRIPSGALSFATRHNTWNGTSAGSSGYDVAIVRNRGMNHFNGPMLGSEIYPGRQQLVFVLIHPKDGRRS